MVNFKLKVNHKALAKASGNIEKLTDKVARKALERTVKKAIRPGIVEARKVAKSIPHLGNTKSLRTTVKSYRNSYLVLAYAGWDAKIPVLWMGREWRSSRHGSRIEFGGTVTRGGKIRRTRPYAVLRKSFAAKKNEMQRVFIEQHQHFMREEAAKLNK